MPEGHSIRRLADQWQELVGERLTLTSPQGRFSSEAAQLTGRKLVATDAHGKHLFLEFEGKQYVHVHLGLYGRFRWHRTANAAEIGAIRLRAVGESRSVDLIGPTRCELLDEAGKQAIHARLGADPLRPADAIDPLLPWLKKSAWPVGKTLMDQSKIAGIGNVYRAEILFILALNPHRATSSLTAEEWQNVWVLARTLLKAGVAHKGRILTTARDLPKPVTLPPGTACADRTYVYKRAGEPCVACGTLIQQEEMDSRTLYWCPTCQA